MSPIAISQQPTTAIFTQSRAPKLLLSFNEKSERKYNTHYIIRAHPSCENRCSRRRRHPSACLFEVQSRSRQDLLLICARRRTPRSSPPPPFARIKRGESDRPARPHANAIARAARARSRTLPHARTHARSQSSAATLALSILLNFPIAAVPLQASTARRRKNERRRCCGCVEQVKCSRSGARNTCVHEQTIYAH